MADITATVGNSGVTATIGGTTSSGPSKVSVSTPSATSTSTFGSLTDVSVGGKTDGDILSYIASTDKFTTVSSLTTFTFGTIIVPTIQATSSSQAFAIPSTDGSSGQAVITDGSGNLSIGTVENAIADASTSVKGKASFSSDNFAVSSGAVTIKDSGISNDELAGSIANAKLSNSTITFTDGSSSTDISLGGTVTFSAGEGIDVAESSGTITFSAEDASTSNKGVASFSSDNFAVSSGAVTIKDGGVANAELANSSVNYGGISLSLGGSDTTPAFDLSDATNYPTSSLSGTITNAQLAGSIANAKLANSSVNFGGITLALGASDTTPAFDLSDATNYPTSSLSGTITNAQLAGSIANSKLANSSLTINGETVALGGSTSINTSLTLAADSGSNDTFSTGGTLTFSGGEGIDTTVSDDEITIAGEDATTSNKGVASFSSDNFAVSSGAVTIKDGGVANAELAGSIANAKLSNSTITVAGDSGSTAIDLGDTLTVSGTTNEIETSQSGDTLTIGLPNNVVVGNNLTVTGNFTVEGSTTTIESTNKLVSDKLLELGHGRTGSAAGDAGIVIERGDDVNAFIGFDESADKFIVGTGTFTGASSGNLSITTSELVANIDGNNSTITNIPNSAFSNSSITIGDESSNEFDVALGTSLSIIGGEGVDTAITGNIFTISGEDASTSNKGIASFSSDDFSVSSGDVTIKSGGVTNAQLAGSIANSKLANSSITINGSAVALGGSTSINTSLTLAADSGSNDSFTTGSTLTFSGGEGIDTTVSDDEITIAGEDASTSNKGIASFASADFDVSSGAVTIKAGGVSNTQLAGSIENAKLANSSITINGEAIALGGSVTTPGSDNPITIGDDSSNVYDVNLGTSLSFLGGEGINTQVAGGTVTISAEDATDSNKGVASFSSDDFSVSSGAVTVKSGGITNDQLAGSIANDKLAGSIANSKLANSSITINGSAVALGGSITVTATNAPITFGDDASNNFDVAPGEGMSILGGEGINTVISGPVYTISAEDATDSNKGVASFSTDNFSVSSGAVTIKDDGVATAEIQDDAITSAKIADNAVVTASINDSAVTNAKLANSTITIGDESSNTFDINLGDELSIIGGEGVDTTITGNLLTVAGEDASTSNKGIASFSSDDFAVSSGSVTVKAGGITNTQLAGSIANSKLANSSITINGSGVSLGGSVSIDTSFTLAADSGSNDSFSTGNTLTFSGGEGIDTTVSDDEITIAGEDATTSNKGIASFSSDDFSVSSGAVTIKSSGITNTQLANSSISIGDDSSTSRAISLGEQLDIVGSGGITTAISNNRIAVQIGSSSLIPDTDDAYDLGSASKRWRSLFVGADTINIGGAELSSADGSSLTIPGGSKIKNAQGTPSKVSLMNDIDQPIIDVNFFSKAGGTGSANAILNFKRREKPVLSFTKTDGTAEAGLTLFSF